MIIKEEQIETCDRETLPSSFEDSEKEILRKFFSSVENPKPATEELKDVYRIYGKYVCTDVSAFLSNLEASNKRVAELERCVIDTAASLAAAISLLERGGNASKKAAPSDKMFDLMLADYRKSLSAARRVCEVGETNE